jgi:hypothetical protein
MIKGTWFERSKLTLQEDVLLTYFHMHKLPQLNSTMEFHASPAAVFNQCNPHQEECNEILKYLNQTYGTDHTMEMEKQSMGILLQRQTTFLRLHVFQSSV